MSHRKAGLLYSIVVLCGIGLLLLGSPAWIGITPIVLAILGIAGEFYDYFEEKSRDALR